MKKGESISVEIINPPTPEQADKKLEDLSAFLSKELSKNSPGNAPKQRNKKSSDFVYPD
ncbi:MAG: hypothetical protein LBS36_01990 [Oscillospiraceae bacterium]|nr:hypothetical protein [Oscillospiraceae bacterium]